MSRKELDDWILEIGVEVHRLSNELSPAGPKLARQRAWAPRIDVLELPDHVLIKVELSGVRAGQFTVQYSLERHCLQVRGERNDEAVCPGIPTLAHQLEIEYGPFAREVKLPDVGLKVEETQAQLTHGMLKIVIPKGETEEEQHYVVERTISVRRLR
ncbi:MAG: Hsp20/alpha crystallin family protein [Armatimonadetes bacterium]|nr:Hsp20/alpha crystallin family protein [Armatimonadota bacterium]